MMEAQNRNDTFTQKPKSGLKKEHSLVLAALENANAKLGRPCLLRKVTAELKEEEKKLLNKTYAKKLSLAVSSILILLTARGLVETADSATKQRFFGSKRVLKEFKLPEILSRRRKVLFLVEKAVARYKRAVRIEEVLEFTEQLPVPLESSPRKITADIIGLVQTGELKRVNFEAFGFRGNTFYLPAGLPEAEYLPVDSSNWLEKTYKCFQIVWKRNAEESSLLQEKISPVTTAEVRREFYKQYPEAAGKISVKRFINMLLYLSGGGSPKVRKVNNPHYNSSAWLPVSIKDYEVLPAEQFYASDAERVEEAVRRGEKLLNSPVNIAEVEAQINSDERLKLKSDFSAARMLNNAAKPMTANKRSEKVQRKVRYVGSVDGRMYYTSGVIKFELAEQIVGFWKLRSEFEKLKCEEQLNLINASSLPYLQYGRLHLLGLEIQRIKTGLDLLNFEDKTGSILPEIEEIKERLGFKAVQIELLKRKHEPLINKKYDLNKLTRELENCAPAGLLPAEVMKIVYPFYPAARRLKKDHQLVTFFHDAVDRFPNPNFKNRFSKNPRQAAEYLYDRTNLLIHAAVKWGNRFSQLQALIARQELGAIRNPNYIYPLLKDEDFTVRLKAVSCLGFMSGESVTAVLEEVSRDDIETNVRRVAQWSKTLASNNLNEIVQLFKAHVFNGNL
jgi:hypothetical protein